MFRFEIYRGMLMYFWSSKWVIIWKTSHGIARMEHFFNIFHGTSDERSRSFVLLNKNIFVCFSEEILRILILIYRFAEPINNYSKITRPLGRICINIFRKTLASSTSVPTITVPRFHSLKTYRPRSEKKTFEMHSRSNKQDKVKKKNVAWK